MTRERAEEMLPGDTGNSSFLDHLLAESPSLQVLDAIKEFGRQWRHVAESPLAGKPSAVIYYSTIAAGMVRHGVRLSSLSDEDLRVAFQWATQYAGAEGLRPLFLAALRII